MANLSLKKVCALRNGQIYYRVWGWPVPDAAAAAWQRPCPRIDGVHFMVIRCEVAKLGRVPANSVLNRYFSNIVSAQEFLDEIFKGFHPAALSEVIYWTTKCDNIKVAMVVSI